MIQKITPFLWFDDQAEAAAKLYTSIFKNSKITDLTRYGKAGPGPDGSVMIISFELEGQAFTALNGGPQYRFTEAVSFFVSCETQAEVDELWDKFTEEGEEGPCGWLKDKFGLSWQIVPAVLSQLLSDPNPAKSQHVMQVMMQMKKLIIADLEKAAKQTD